MKIAIHSDLHLEGNVLPKNFGSEEVIDVVVLAGDIGVYDIHMNLRDIKEKYPNAKNFVYDSGNHEYYNFEYYAREAYLKHICRELGIVYLNDNTGLLIDGYYFFGATGWSDLCALHGYPSYEEKYVCQHGISDFFKIDMGDRRFTPDDMIEISKKQKRDIEMKLAIAKMVGNKAIVVTHFPPVLEVRNPSYPNDNVTSYFHNDWSDLIYAYEPFAWIYGHIHYNSPVQNLEGSKTHLWANQRGYNKEPSNRSYDPKHIIEV